MVFDERYLKFFELFNERDFYECHEVLEDLWMETQAQERPYYQGLIQTATAFYHLENGNLRGADKLFVTGLNYLSHFPEAYLGFDLGGYRAVCEQWHGRVRRRLAGETVELASADFPVLSPPA